MKIIFFGTPDFAANMLDDLVRANVEVVAIVTKPDKPQGRSSKLVPTRVKAKAHDLLPHIPVYQPEKCSTPEFVSILQSFAADLYVVVAYGEILRQEVLDIPPLGCINVHASLLPAYRGAAPIQRCIMNGDKESGVSIIKLVRKMDAGDVVKMGRLTVSEEMIAPELEQALCRLGASVLLETLVELQAGTAVFTPQEHDKVTFAEKILPADCDIDWNMPSCDIHNKVRALTPHPGAYFYATIRGERKRVKILRSKSWPHENKLQALCYQTKKNELMIGCSSGSLQVLELQIEGKAMMQAEVFLRGCALSEFQISS